MFCRALLLLSLLLPLLLPAQSIARKSQNVKLKKGLSFTLNVPKGYRLLVAAEGLRRPRFFAKSPDGRLFVTDLHDKSDNKKGRLLLLDDWNDTLKRFQTSTIYLANLHNPNQVAFYTRNGKHYLYVAETGKLTVFEYKPKSTAPSTTGKIIATFPDSGLHYKYGGWHLTRSLAFHQEKLYISVGSSCNACIEKEEARAVIIEMNPDGTDKKIFARGLRNSVGIKWINSQLWVSSMGRDGIGPDKPEDLFHTVHQNGFYGWPYYYQYRQKIYTDVAFKDSVRPAYVKAPPPAAWGFAAHSAPLGFEYLTDFNDTTFNKSFLVALHGSTSVWRQRGNAVVQLLPNGRYREVVSVFLQGKNESQRYGRPCDVLQWSSRSFLISDDKNGVIYFVEKE